MRGGRLRRLGAHTAYVDSTPDAAANAGIVVGRDAVLVVDARMAPSYGAEVLSAARRLGGPGATRAYLVNTHHHGDHCFGNAAFADAVHVASAACRERMEVLWDEEVAKMSRGRPESAALFAEAPRKLPEVLLTGPVRVDLGGVEAVLHPVGPAHTAGDVAVHVPADGVLFGGDLTFHGHWPFVTEVDLPGLFSAFARCRALGATVIVPGHGAAEESDRALDTMAACMRSLVDRALEAPGPADGRPPERFADWLHPERVRPAVERFRALAAEDPRIATLGAPGI